MIKVQTNDSELTMIKRLSLPLLLSLLLGSPESAPSQKITLANPSFERGQTTPQSWSLSSGRGEWLKGDASDGERAITVTGDGEDNNYWRSASLPFAPTATYQIAFRARNLGATDGTPVTGPVFCNRDLGRIAAEWTEYRSIFVTPAAVDTGNAWVRFGQWHADGTIAFDQVELTRVQPLYLEENGVVLGDGELIQGNEYSFIAPFNAQSRNHSRPLMRHACGFNTYRWVFGAADLWPDPLPPLHAPIDIPAGVNQPIWVRAGIPSDAAPGTYSGTLRLRAPGYSADVPLQVEVYDFTLPRRMSCTTAFGFSFNNVVRYHNLTTETQKRAVLDRYLANYSSHHISPYDPAPLDPIEVTWEGLQPRFTWDAWDAAMEHAIDKLGFNAFRLSLQGLGGGTFHARREPELLGYAEDTPEYRQAFGAYLRGIEAHLRDRGWLDEAYVYWFDEPAPRDYEFVMNGFRKLRENAPGINRMLTEQVEPELVGGPNIWCPVSNAYDPQRSADRREAGDTFWWYVCTGPKAPYAGLFIDHPGTELRVWLWQTWQYGLDGILVWQSNYWTSDAAYPDGLQNPYQDPMGWTSGYSTSAGVRRPWGNGDGRFVYPPEAAAGGTQSEPVLDGPVDSIRWEMLRDGIEDYEYFAILRDRLEQRTDLSAADRTRYQDLLEVPSSVTASMTRFTVDPTPIEAHRHALARAIEMLSR